MHSLALNLVTVLGLFTARILYTWRKKSACTLPPGPKGLPVLGNVMDIPKSHEWMTYETWGKEFRSDIIHAEAFGTHLIILNSAKAARELLERRSSLYSDRPPLVALNVLLKFAWSLASSGYGPRWRNLRREFHRYFHPTAVRQYHKIESHATLELLCRLLKAPNDFMVHIRHMAGQTIIKIAYGIDVQPKNDPYIEAAEEALKAFAFGSTTRAGMFDTFPMLAKLPTWVPGNSFRREADKWAISVLHGIEKPYRSMKDAAANGIVDSSVMSQMIQSSADEDLIKHTAGTMYLAGADTTVSAIETFILAMVLYPEAQRKAQAELDNVVGTHRLPDFTDESKLPYVTALMKEVLRWRPVAPLAIPHRIVCDDVYEGYFIPAGSIVIGNTWAMLHDENVFPDPDPFKPERFLANPEHTLFPDAAFGFGRRICPARYMARDALWIAIASILATFNISKARNEEGNEIEPTDEYTSGFISYPVPFKCTIRPRSMTSEQLIRGSEM